MPTYTVTSPAGRLTEVAKRRIAKLLTSIHHEETGAPSYFAQVLVQEVADGNHFLGGEPLAEDQVFVCGQIRAGRSADTKARMIERMVAAVAECADLPAARVWIYLVDIPAGQMAEFGRILPQPGAEGAWVAGLDPADRARMERDAA